MKFPVDLLADVSQAELERLAHNYTNNLLYSNPDSSEHLTLTDSTQVTIDISSVGFVPLYGSSDKQKILALFSPSDPFTAVALYLLDQWWAVNDILKTTDPARDGAVEVETLGERIVLYILNRVIYRAKEMSSEELPFLCHGEKDNAKILWKNGEAVGFYSVKPSGSLCKSFSTRSYQLPVMDSIFVRKCQRGKGFGLQMLEDFVLSFKENCLGLRYPLTKSMYKVCERYLCQYPGDTDLLWEVESIGGPNQRTNIANKIQAMDLSAVSKSLSFTEESLVITEVTEKDVVMEAITTQIKKAESMECTVEIVEEVTLVRATKEAEVPVASRGRSSGSKQRKMGEKIAEDKSEKVIRIEDIEAETPREEQVSAQLKTELYNVSELVQTEGSVFSVDPDEKEEDVDAAPEEDEEEATMLDKPAIALASQDLEEADVTSAPSTEEQQVEDDATQDLTSHDSQITVENVASEIEEAEEKCHKKDTAMLVISEEVLEVYKEAETVGEVTDEKSEESFTQHEVSLSTHVTSEDGEAGKTGRTSVKAIKTVQGETLRRRSQRLSKPEEGISEETAAKVLRGRTVMTAPTPKRKYTRHSQKICEEFQKEVDEVAEENELPTTKVVEELAVTEGEEPQEITSINEDVVSVDGLREKKQLEDEQLSNEEETEKQVGSGVEDTVVKGSSTEPPDTAETALTKEIEDEKVPDESEKDQKGVKVETSVIQDKQEVSDDGIEEPPVVQKRALTDRCEVTPKPKSTKQSKRHQKQDEEHTDEADLEAGGSAEKADEQAMDKQMEEHHQVEQEDTVDKTEEEITVVEDGTIPKAAKAAEDVIPSSGMNMEESKEVQEEEETGGETEIVSVMEADKEEVAGDMIQEPDTVAAASETITPDEVLDEATAPVAEEPQEKDTGCEIPKLQKAAVILVDLKTTCHHLSIKEAEGTPVDGECAAPEKVKMELIAAEEKEVPSCVAEEQTPEPEMLVLEEEGGGKQENSTEISVNATAEAETVEKEELREDYSDKEKEESANVNEGKSEAEEAPVIETRVLRGGRKTVEASCKSISRSNQQQEEDNIGEDITEKRVDEAETGTEMEREMEAMAKDDITVTAPVEEKQSVSVSAHISETADIPVVDYVEENPPLAGVEEALCLEEEESPVVATRALRSETKTATPRHKTTSSRKQSDEQEAGNSEKEKTAVTTRTLRFGRISASATHMRKSRRICEQIQGEEQKGEEESKSVDETGVEEEQAVKKAAVEKTDEEIEETNEEEIGEKVQSLCRDRLLQFVTVEVEKVVSEGTMSMTEEEENTDGVTPAADNLEVQQGETDIPLPKPTTDSAILSEEDATPSAEEQQSGDQKDGVPFPQRVTVVLVDLKKTHHDIQEETAAIKEGVPVEKTAAEAEEEQREETMPEKHVPSSSVRIEKTELEKVVVVEEGFEEKVEDAITIQDTVEGIAQETAEEDVAKSVDDESTSTSEVIETVAGESAQEALLTAKDDEGKGASEEKEAPVIETRRLRSGEKTMRATTRSKTTKRQHDKQEEEAIREKSTEGEPAVEKRVLRKGRCTVTHKSKRIRTQCQTEEEGEDKTTPAEEIQVEETKVVLEEAEREEDSINEKIEENNEEEAAAQKEDKTEQEVEMEKVEVVAEESLKEQETVEEEQLAVLETCTDRQAEASVRESAEETPTTDEGKVPGVEEAPTVETRVLRSGGKAIKATPRSKNTKTVVEKRADKDEPTVGAGVLRKGRSAPATPRRKSKRACTQCQLEEEREEETTPAEETEGEEEEAGQDWPEEKCEKAEEEGKSMEMEVKKGKDVEEEEIESAVGGESAVGDAKPIQVASTEEAVVLEKEDNNLNLVTAVDETGTDTVEILSAEAEETNSAEEEETTVIEKSTAATEVGSDTTIAEKEVLVALVEDASVVAKEEAPATRTLRKSKTSHVTPSQRSRRQKDQGVVETQLQDEETQEVHQLTDDSSEKRELYAKEQAETEERSNFGQGTGPPAEDAAEEQNKETADLIDNRVVEPAGEEPAIEEMELPEEELSDGKDTSSVVEGRSLRRRMKTDADKEEDKAGEIQLPKRRSIRKRPRVDYRENDDDEEENEEGETEAATDKEEEAEVGSDEDKDNKKAECSANELIEKREESSREENLENDKGAIESTSEKGGILNLVLDPDEEVETAGISQDDKEYEQNVSEEEVEPIVIGTRVLRGRSVPSITITPQSKSRCCSAKVQKAEESDEERSPQSSQKRNLRKRKSTEVTPTRKSKRHSRV